MVKIFVLFCSWKYIGVTWQSLHSMCFDADVANILGNSLESALEREAQPFLNRTNLLLNRESYMMTGLLM